MYCRILFEILVLLVVGECCFKSIPEDSIILTTSHLIYSIRPLEKNGNDQISSIFESKRNTTILRSIFDSNRSALEVFQMNDLTKTIEIDHIENDEKSFPFRKKVEFDKNSIDFRRFGLFNVHNEDLKYFSVDLSENLNLFSSDGSIRSRFVLSSEIKEHIESVSFHGLRKRFFFVTSTSVSSCRIIKSKDIDCCSKVFPERNFRHGSFNNGKDENFFYVFDLETGIYRVNLSQSFCPTDFHLIKSFGDDFPQSFNIERDFFAFSTLKNENRNQSSVFLGFLHGESRSIEVRETIVDLDFNFGHGKEKKADGPTFHESKNMFIIFLGIFCALSMFLNAFLLMKSVSMGRFERKKLFDEKTEQTRVESFLASVGKDNASLRDEITFL